MKLLWQQIVGMLIAIIVALTIIAVRVERSVTNEIQTNRQEQLLNYGRNIVSNDFSRKDLERASQMLASENIVIQVYLPNGRIIYPSYNQKFNAPLNPQDLQTLYDNEIVGFRTVERENQKGVKEPYLSIYLPFHTGGQFPMGFISLGAPLDELESRLSAVRKSIYMSFFIAIAIGILISVVYAWFQTHKIQRLRLATKQIAAGNYDISVDTDAKDELGDLARDFAAMTRSLKDSQEEIRRQEDLRKQFLLDAAHEMRTPLTTMSGILEGLQHGLIPEQKRERSLELVAKETARLARLVNENLDYERIRTNQYQLNCRWLSLTQLFRDIYEQMMIKAKDHHIWITMEAVDDLQVWADYDRLKQILINLMTNAIQFAHDSELIVRASSVDDGVQIEVIDQGMGIQPKDIDKIWERFYKADISRTNTKFGESGIGLSIVHSLVEAHGGTIAVESRVGQGTTFTIVLPNPDQK